MPGSTALTAAVAKSLFKLMAYKDEYEVARLHMETGFLDKLREEFEGDFTVNYHLAPPLVPSAKDARGRPLKRRFGSWIQPAFRILARLRFLRGTAFDVFGYTRERRTERELIGWYRSLVEGLLPRLARGTIDANGEDCIAADGDPRLRSGQTCRDREGKDRDCRANASTMRSPAR